MPSLIKANASLLAGNPQLTKYNVSTQNDGGISISAEFVMLAQFSDDAYNAFRIGSDVHPALQSKNDVVAALRINRATYLPRLTSADIVTTSGLSTISLTYGGEADIDSVGTDANGEPKVTSEITTSTDLRSFSGSVTDTSITPEKNVSIAFDYYATSVTAENAKPIAIAPGEPFNIRSRLSVRRFVSTQNVYASRTYRNNLGQSKATNSVTVIYVQSVFTV